MNIKGNIKKQMENNDNKGTTIEIKGTPYTQRKTIQSNEKL